MHSALWLLLGLRTRAAIRLRLEAGVAASYPGRLAETATGLLRLALHLSRPLEEPTAFCPVHLRVQLMFQETTRRPLRG